MNVPAVTKALNGYINSHGAQFKRLSHRQSQLLEIGALTVVAKHYEIAGYNVSPQNLAKNDFKVKMSTRGAPWNFSWFQVSGPKGCYEIHANLPVQDAYATEGARFVVDVAVIPQGCLPTTVKDRKAWASVVNSDLITFVEAKALVVYPMLIAHFIGIVHELQPRFLSGRRPYGFSARGHFDPALVSLGYLHGTCGKIVSGFRARKCKVKVVPDFDSELSKLAQGLAVSPLS